jgi:hypothetical protein
LEILAKGVQALRAGAAGQAPQEVDAGRHLVQHRGAERRLGGRLHHVHLEETRHLDRRRQGLEIGGDGTVALGRRAGAAGVQLGQHVARRGEATGRVLARLEARQVVHEVVDGFRAGDGRREVGDQDLAVDQLGDEGIGVFLGDLQLAGGGILGGGGTGGGRRAAGGSGGIVSTGGIVGAANVANVAGVAGRRCRHRHQRRGEVGGADAVPGKLQGGFQVIGGLHGHQVMGAHLVLEARLGITQPARRPVEAGVRAVAQLAAHRRVALQLFAEREQVIHVEASVAAIGATGGQGEPGRGGAVGRRECRAGGVRRGGRAGRAAGSRGLGGRKSKLRRGAA